ncbi:MAG: response regulator [Gammaproteobacteria bacterium]|nr:response regulator [Gammaproteobacteria bacterium]
MGNNNFALVIDDSVSMRQYVASILRQDGRVGEIVEAESPDHALRLLQQHDGNLQFIVSDWNMPGMPLAEFLKSLQLRPRLAGAPIFLLTAENEQKARSVADSVGATAVLTKPFDPERLMVLALAAVGVVERRCAKRILPFIGCEVDLGFTDTQLTYAAEIVNISDSGVLLRSRVPAQGVGYVYDIATLVLRPATGETLKLYAQIIRIEGERTEPKEDKKVLIAFEFGRIDDGMRRLFRQYLQMNDPEAMIQRPCRQ